MRRERPLEPAGQEERAESSEREMRLRRKAEDMDTMEITVDGRQLGLYGDPGSGSFFLQPVDEHDASLMESEAAALAERCGHGEWCLVTIPVDNWNEDLTPWKNAPVFGREGFGDGAQRTLDYICGSVIPCLEEQLPADKRSYYLCGYSLAGLFALWGGYQTDAFAGVAGVSPSVWYPGWREYAAQHEVKTDRVYLSLGLKEEKTRNRVMAAVGDAIRDQYSLLLERGTQTVLEWNPGNHFVDSDSRMAKGLAWLLERKIRPEAGIQDDETE